jgi:hypothetical protein
VPLSLAASRASYLFSFIIGQEVVPMSRSDVMSTALMAGSANARSIHLPSFLLCGGVDLFLFNSLGSVSCAQSTIDMFLFFIPED